MKESKFCPTCMGTKQIYKIQNGAMSDKKSVCPDCSTNWFLIVFVFAIVLGVIETIFGWF